MRKAYFGLLLIVFLSILSDLSAQSTSATASPPATSAAPPGVYFLTQGVWVTTHGYAYGFGTGTQLELVQDSGDRLRVKAGDFEFDVNRSLVTNDLDIARRAWQTEVEQLQKKTREQQEIAQAIKRREEHEAAATLAPNKPFFDDPNYKSIFDRDRERAQKGEQKQYQRASEDRLAEIIAKAARKEARKTRSQESQAEIDAQMAESRARHEVENLETRLSSAHEPLSSSERASYQNGVGKDVHQAGDSNLENRFQEAMRKDDDARRQQDYEYNKEATEKLHTRP